MSGGMWFRRRRQWAPCKAHPRAPGLPRTAQANRQSTKAYADVRAVQAGGMREAARAGGGPTLGGSRAWLAQGRPDIKLGRLTKQCKHPVGGTGPTGSTFCLAPAS